MTTTTDPGFVSWDRLSEQSTQAVRWAAAATRSRDQSGHADGLDLLAGIMLAQPADSPPRQAAEHFGIPVGAVLVREGTPPPDADALLAGLSSLPPDPQFPLHAEVLQILDQAVRLVDRASIDPVLLQRSSSALCS